MGRVPSEMYFGRLWHSNMTDLEQILRARGFGPEDIAMIAALVEDRQGRLARQQAGHLLQLIFLRLDRDSPHGCALRRALGFSVGVSLETAAKTFCVSKQYMHDLQRELESKLGDLSFIARENRARSATQVGHSLDALDHLEEPDGSTEPAEGPP